VIAKKHIKARYIFMNQEREKEKDKEARESLENRADIIKDIDNKIKELSKEKTPINKLIIESLSKEREALKKDLEKSANDLSIQELNQRKAVLRAELEALQKNKKVDLAKFKQLKSGIDKINSLLRLKRKDIKYFTASQLSKLLRIADQEKGKPYGLMVLLAYEGACRPGELLKIKINDLNLIENTLFIQRLKGSNDTLIYLSKKLNTKLKKHLKLIEGKDQVFLFETKGKPYDLQNFRKIFQRLCLKANISNDIGKIHNLRHTRAIESVKKGANLREIQYILGHKELKNVMIYLTYTPNNLEIEQLFNKIND
jgi:integrase